MSYKDPSESRDDEMAEASDKRICTPAASSGKGGGGVRKNLCSVRRKRMRSKMEAADESPVESGDGGGGCGVGGVGGGSDEVRRASVVSDGCKKAKKTILLPKRFCGSRDRGRADSPERTSTQSVTSQARNCGNSNNNSSSSRKMDNHLAMIFMGIVLIFLGHEVQCRRD